MRAPDSIDLLTQETTVNLLTLDMNISEADHPMNFLNKYTLTFLQSPLEDSFRVEQRGYISYWHRTYLHCALFTTTANCLSTNISDLLYYNLLTVWHWRYWTK
jgi:hypothetical protein